MNTSTRSGSKRISRRKETLALIKRVQSPGPDNTICCLFGSLREAQAFASSLRYYTRDREEKITGIGFCIRGTVVHCWQVFG